MGSLKGFKPTEDIEAVLPSSLVVQGCMIRTGINALEDCLLAEFPFVLEETQVSHVQMQEAVASYFREVSLAIRNQKIKENPVPIDQLKILPQLFPGFIKYLSDFGKVGFGRHFYRRDLDNVSGLFLDFGEGFRHLGFLNNSTDGLQREYCGYVPTKLSQGDFHTSPVYHLRNGPTGLNSVFVRLFSEVVNGKSVRIDGYEKQGIAFP